MKTLYKYSILAVSVFFIGCQEDYLEEPTTSIINPENLLTSKTGAEVYTVGAYDAARNAIASNWPSSDTGGWLNIWGVIAADEVVLPGWSPLKPIYLHTLSPSDVIIRYLWENMYISLNRVNSVVDRVGAMTEDQISLGERDKLVAEARFLRAMINFGLVCSWENIPLVKNETTSLDNLNVSQSSPLEVYEFIIQDLIFAKNNLVAEQGGGRATKGSAQALLGKVYLQMTGHPINDASYFAKAEAELKAVMDSNVYNLMSYYPDIFTLENEQNNEIVFSFGFDGPGLNQGSRIGTFYGPLGPSINGGANGNNWYVNWELAGPPTGPGNTGNWANGKGPNKLRNNYSFAQPYTDDDVRARNNIVKSHVNRGYMSGVVWPYDGMFDSAVRREWKGNWKPWKWHNIRPSNWGSDTPLDEAYIRYSDVLLMYAESLNGQGKLTQADADMTINLVRARARVFPNNEIKDDTVIPSMIVGSLQDNADEILSERRKELCFEGWRRNDLIRNGKYFQAINSNQPVWSNSGNPQPQYTPNEIRWPIPASELQLNSELAQNEGY